MYKLKPFERDDFPTIIEWSGDERFLLQWSGPSLKYPLDENQLEKLLDGANKEGNSESLMYKVIDSHCNEMVGIIALSRLNYKHRTGRIGKVLTSPTMRGKGLGKWMMKEMCRIGFEELSLHRISLGVFDFNEGAIRCYEKVGFQKDGLLREVVQVDGEYWNMFEMSMLEDEWKDQVSKKR
ncbi:GNAT family N-acetyltransferase [Bacillus solimangrovi]|uniref:GNAT family N-acetyltransferase n=1 Tax=Bacillus solimangrovi TaxID=1305675 RepID=A0A1E5LIZ1_9BACI|nr:GNAT family protein [Bacillus solimangrovi]OEH93998.1 GNAT family N-acetyltransferase [Bacillus solimangrovi]